MTQIGSNPASLSPSEPQLFRARFCAWPCWPIVLALVAAGFAALAVDLPLSRWSLAGHCPKPLSQLLERSEAFGFGTSVAVILLTVFVLDPGRRWAIPRVLIMVFGAGLSSDAAKMLLDRTRPRAFLLPPKFLAADGAGIWQTFGHWLRFARDGSDLQSFPSAHTATAVALAVTLATLYPRGRWLFCGLAMLVACQRVESGAHFLSDACWGAALGWLVAVGVGRSALRALGIGRWEDTWSTRYPGSTGAADDRAAA